MTITTIGNANSERSILASLRSLIPDRKMSFTEALRTAELQASRLLERSGIDDGAVPDEIVTELPRIRVEYRDLPTSGMSFWTGQSWVIALNSTEPATRQRFTLFHEFKHIIDHGHTQRLYTGTQRVCSEVQAEQAADYFAGCALMSKRILRRAWATGTQRPQALAYLLNVSPRAVDVRLSQLGLTEPRVRCAPVSKLRYAARPGTYLRQLSVNTPIMAQPAGAL